MFGCRFFDWEAGVFILNVPPGISECGGAGGGGVGGGGTIFDTDTPVELIVAEGGADVGFDGGESYAIVFAGDVECIVAAWGGG